MQSSRSLVVHVRSLKKSTCDECSLTPTGCGDFHLCYTIIGMVPFFSQSEENSQVDLFDRNVVNRFSTKGEVLLFSSYAKKVRL